VADTGAARIVEAIWRSESPRIIAALTRLVRDVGLAEQLAQDAFVAALEEWPASGTPESPGAWLMAAARKRAIDALRRDALHRSKVAELESERAARDAGADLDPALAAEDEVGDDLLRLIFLCCHPVLPAEARTALTLRLLAGLTTDEIARAYLAPEPTIAQRIVRAKRTLAEQRVPFELPGAERLAERLDSVLEVLYLIFNEGYAGTAGEEWVRADLCEEGLRLGRILAGSMPAEPEVHGLVALMELQASRLSARRTPAGDPVLLLEQDRGEWDRLMIQRGLAALARAQALGREPGKYALEAAIAACHARAPRPADTDWPRIVALYGELARVAPSPVVDLNRAVAVAMAFGPAAGLLLVDRLAPEPQLARYHLLPSVRGDLLAKLGRLEEARAELERAAAMTRNERERAILLRRAAACAPIDKGDAGDAGDGAGAGAGAGG
jgi:RNA polymerase sigma factor (sigma-70 family)